MNMRGRDLFKENTKPQWVKLQFYGLRPVVVFPCRLIGTGSDR
jgi:hypothetical protein